MTALRKWFAGGTSLPCAVLVMALCWTAGLSAQDGTVSLGGTASQSGTVFRITGTVVSGRDGSPIPRCRLSASPSGVNRGGNEQPVNGQSDERGRFALQVPSAGNWQLTASGRNLHPQTYEAHGGFFTGIVLSKGQPTYDVVFRAMPDGILTGAVIDEAGEAVRNAPVSLATVDPGSGATGAAPSPRTQQATTDDRGHYEFSGLEAGAYLVSVRTRPWYAVQGVPPSKGPEPPLDLVYPVTWYPGTTEEAGATPLPVHAGDRLQADFHLLPIAAAHLRLPVATPPEGSNGGFRGPAQVSLLLPNGQTQQVFGSYNYISNGEMDMGGLAPGTYQVTLPGFGPQQPGRTTIVRVAGAGSITEVGSGTADSTLTLSTDGDTGLNASRITLVDTATRRVISAGNRRGGPGGFGGPGQPRRLGLGGAAGSADAARTPPQSTSAPDAHQAATLELPPGRYEVVVPTNSGAFLKGLTATGAKCEGRFLTLGEESASVVVHLASGLATVEGTATLAGKAASGALVLLVPTTLGAPTSLAVVHRDQSNTDGSFRMTGVVPGQYILVAIDHGWGVRWSDPPALRPYLLHGTPLDLAPSATASAKVEATAP